MFKKTNIYIDRVINLAKKINKITIIIIYV